MKTQNKNIALVVFIALTAIGYFTYLSFRDEKEVYSWFKTYQDGNREPYDFAVFKSLLQQRSGSGFKVSEKKLCKNLSESMKKDSSCYIFIGSYCFLNKEEIDSLLDYASSGHHVMLIAEGLPDTLMEALSYYGKPISMDRFDDHTVTCISENDNSKSQGYRFNFRSFQNKLNEYTEWYFLNEEKQLSYYYENICDRYIPLNRINGKVNYAMFKIGKGALFIHTSPLLFTNYALRSDSSFTYLNEIFVGINTKNILYDIGSRNYKTDSENIAKQSDSPLSYILKQDALKWAWYLFLITTILFFLFRARRNQRMVPVLEQKRNTSKGFIETMSGLFYSGSNHRKMAETKMQLFLYFIRHKLKITTHMISAETYRLIAIRTGVPEIEVESLFDYYKQVVEKENAQMSAEDLMDFHNRITRFYIIYKIKK